MKRIVVIGGGAAGLVASIFASQNDNEVILLEKNNVCGKKILMTGNGKCNYFNDDFAIEHYRSNNLNILEKIITEENKAKVLHFFDSIGIIPKIKNGYYYPCSEQALSIRDALVLQAKLVGVDIRNNVEVLDIEYKNNKFIITTSVGEIKADNVILASGSKAAPNTGSDGFGYEIAKKFGHTIITPLPALVQLQGIGNYFKDWAGVRSDVIISLYEDDKKIAEEAGEIQLTDYGISGICVFQFSGRVARGIAKLKTERVLINFLPWLAVKNIDDLVKWLTERNKKIKKRTIAQLLNGMLNHKLVNVLLNKCKIVKNKQWDDLTSEQKKAIATNFISFPLTIKGTNSFDKAQVCSGGIPLNEINIKTMESLKQKGLYLVGEILDVDGECGGYNLGFAWLSGILAGIDVSKQ